MKIHSIAEKKVEITEIYIISCREDGIYEENLSGKVMTTYK